MSQLGVSRVRRGYGHRHLPSILHRPAPWESRRLVSKGLEIPVPWPPAPVPDTHPTNAEHRVFRLLERAPHSRGNKRTGKVFRHAGACLDRGRFCWDQSRDFPGTGEPRRGHISFPARELLASGAPWPELQRSEGALRPNLSPWLPPRTTPPPCRRPRSRCLICREANLLVWMQKTEVPWRPGDRLCGPSPSGRRTQEGSASRKAPSGHIYPCGGSSTVCDVTLRRQACPSQQDPGVARRARTFALAPCAPRPAAARRRPFSLGVSATPGRRGRAWAPRLGVPAGQYLPGLRGGGGRA